MYGVLRPLGVEFDPSCPLVIEFDASVSKVIKKAQKWPTDAPTQDQVYVITVIAIDLRELQWLYQLRLVGKSLTIRSSMEDP